MTRPGPGVHDPGKETYRRIEEGQARPGIIIAIWWCPAHKGVPGDEKADEVAKLAAGEPDAHWVEWLRYPNWTRQWQVAPRGWPLDSTS